MWCCCAQQMMAGFSVKLTKPSSLWQSIYSPAPSPAVSEGHLNYFSFVMSCCIQLSIFWVNAMAFFQVLTAKIKNHCADCPERAICLKGRNQQLWDKSHNSCPCHNPWLTFLLWLRKMCAAKYKGRFSSGRISRVKNHFASISNSQ